MVPRSLVPWSPPIRDTRCVPRPSERSCGSLAHRRPARSLAPLRPCRHCPRSIRGARRSPIMLLWDCPMSDGTDPAGVSSARCRPWPAAMADAPREAVERLPEMDRPSLVTAFDGRASARVVLLAVEPHGASEVCPARPPHPTLVERHGLTRVAMDADRFDAAGIDPNVPHRPPRPTRQPSRPLPPGWGAIARPRISSLSCARPRAQRGQAQGRPVAPLHAGR